jgi:probable F420-dependent oxidoreductase
MKFGINLPNAGPGATPERLGAWADQASELGYHLLMISDHVAHTPDVSVPYPPPFYDPFVTMSWLAGRNPELELGTTVVVLPYRHPLLMARMFANIDQLSGGKLIVGIGVGWAQQEFAALDIPFNKRGALSDEALEIMLRFWSEDQISYQGKHFQFKDVATAPRPLQQPNPPIWVAGHSEAAYQRTVRFSAVWHPIHQSVAWMRDVGLARLRAIAEAAQKPMPAFAPRISLKISPTDLPEANRIAGQGSLGQIRRDLEALAELGAQYVLLDNHNGQAPDPAEVQVAWDALALLAKELIDLPGQSLR